MTIAAAICFALAAVAELSGIGLVVREARAANSVLLQYLSRTAPFDSPVMEHYRRLDVGSAHQRQDADEIAVRHLLGSKANARWAVALLVAGVLIGALGNYLSLSWQPGTLPRVSIAVGVVVPLASATLAGLVTWVVAGRQGVTAHENWVRDKRYAVYERLFDAAAPLTSGLRWEDAVDAAIDDGWRAEFCVRSWPWS